MDVQTATEALTGIAHKLKAHLATVTPGRPFHITPAHSPGDGVWQGDLGIEVVTEEVPEGYEAWDPDSYRSPNDMKELARNHRLRSTAGVTRFDSPGPRSLDGPLLIFTEPNAIEHTPGHDRPHGTVYLDAPCAIRIRYQRNLDPVTSEEIRSRD